MLPKKALRAAGDCRKVANGHSTATRLTTKTTALTVAIHHLFWDAVLAQRRSSRKAGTTRSMGNSGGMNWWTGWKTGPSFGSAGKTGKIQTKPMTTRE